ncbi:glycoside hydrolase family 3 C-terminal domain-containing protein [Hephaestia sp. GCM10023244]|uniref:glycoside hydrolase family 3 C-terminal domain-containing protein n=1 Tax=unclassified Hephaestia TaxID=2631281 RepID=UPI00207720C6|nr:glycoside hydrolase family 3 C-terminal domain-containing protein [Hephaestia sp. MAHUQ-44]MCM8732005.1 glycoside hydrolase family 3 C-terminal domain-containing protein [Hephaestia sp. MAHUQ-44]
MGLKARLVGASALALAMVAAGPVAAQDYLNPDLPVDQRAADLVGRMTLTEKAAQMQNEAPGIERLGILPYDYWNEALHGVARAGEATIFPQAIGMAATFDRELFHLEGQVIATEGRAKYNQAQREKNYDRYYGLTFWSPNINIFRDPRWGRGQETLGEDPYLTGTLATEFITGLQGDDPRYLKAVATPKHYAVHSGPEPLRHGFNVDPSQRDLSETYLPAFRRTIIEGKAESLMCAYNAVFGTAACANKWLLQDVLRNDWGFTGFVTSDCGAIDDITTGHHNTRTNAEGAALAVKAGTDTGCDFKDEMLDLPEAVQKGYLTEAQMDVALERVFAARIRLGMFDPPAQVPFTAIPISENHSDAHQQIALRAARESIVLLKNDGLLPLDKTGQKIAVIGPSATSLIALEGNYNGTPTTPVRPLDAMETVFGADRVTYAQGAPFVAELPVAVPRTAFPGGLTARFYNSADFSGPVVATRAEKDIDTNWAGIDPAPGVDRKTFSVRWTGTLAVPAAGDYLFQLETRRGCDAGGSETYTIRIEGSADQVFSAPCNERETKREPMRVHFDDTRPRAFTLELAHQSARAGDVTFTWQAPVAALRDQAVKAAADADVIVAFVGLNAWLEGEEMPLKVPGFDGGDRTSIALPKAQLDLLDALEATGKPVAIVLQSGSAVALGAHGEKANAVLAAWYPGERGGQAIAEVLRGTVNPSGRLPVTFYASTDQLPPFTDYTMANRTYRYFDGKPEYAFGHGLSYTRFVYSDLKPDAASVAAGKGQTVRVTVRNTGARAGDEVAQLYLATPGRAGTPIRSLKGYERVHLAPGEAKTISFALAPRDLAFADDKGVMRVAAAEYKLWVGGGQPSTGAPGIAGSFRVTGDKALPN